MSQQTEASNQPDPQVVAGLRERYQAWLARKLKDKTIKENTKQESERMIIMPQQATTKSSGGQIAHVNDVTKQVALAKSQDPQTLAILNNIMHQARLPMSFQARFAFDDYAARKAENTVRRKIADLALFETFLQSVGVPASGLYDHPESWRGVTWGLVEGFKVWQLKSRLRHRKYQRKTLDGPDLCQDCRQSRSDLGTRKYLDCQCPRLRQQRSQAH
ncbi:MAG: hypothetical protein QM730_15280 [Anaerolineales bacterium]